ncbi:peptide chain release factor-like protein [Candidatus Vidania fulgoroideorum]
MDKILIIKKKILKLKKNLIKINKSIKREKKNEYIKIFKKVIIKKIEMKKNKISIKETEDIIYLEVRTGIGGKESSIFVNEIYNMYKKFLERQSFFYEIFFIKKCSFGIKRAILRIIGKNIFGLLKYENGVHRVQRTPVTDKKQRKHTSTCIVEVYKEDIEKNIQINKKELKIETFKSSGSGGQNVNKTNSAVRIIHIPTGIKVECQKERSQIENKRFAIKLLYLKIKKIKEKEKERTINEKREKNNFIFSSRSFKIRTFNFYFNRITDHIIKKNFFILEEVLYNGRLEKILKKNKLIKNI